MSRTLMTDFHQCVWPDGKGPDDMPQALIVSLVIIRTVRGRTTCRRGL